jgi:hypothetical protein
VPSSLDRRWSAPPWRAGAGPDAAEGRRLVAAGRARVVLLDVLAPASVRDTFTLRLAALRLVVPQRVRDAGGVVCLDTAVWLYAGGPAPARVDVALPPGRPRCRVPGLREHQVAYGPQDLWVPLRTDPVTSPARTAVDVACRRPVAEAVPVLAVLGVTTGLRPPPVDGLLTGLPGRPGVRGAREALQAWAQLLSAGPGPPRVV